MGVHFFLVDRKERLRINLGKWREFQLNASNYTALLIFQIAQRNRGTVEIYADSDHHVFEDWPTIELSEYERRYAASDEGQDDIDDVGPYCQAWQWQEIAEGLEKEGKPFQPFQPFKPMETDDGG